MRTKKSIINAIANIISLIIVFIPNLLVRKVFLNTLGSEMLGLTSLYANIIGWLSIVELGVGSAIIFSLYKPYAYNEYDKIRAYIKFYGEFYRRVGFLILILGLAISIFIGNFIQEDINLETARLGLVLFIINTFISYMFSHKLCLLNVAQESYKITIGTTLSKVIISILQIIILITYPNFLLYISVEIFINLIYFILINTYILKRYYWLNKGKSELKEVEKKDLLKNVKALFMHKIATLIVFSTDNIVISKFLGLKVLTNCTNYQIIIKALQSLLNAILNGMTSSIGNLIAEGNKEKSYDMHKKIFFMNFWIASFIVISLYNTLDQFIVIWLGKENLLDMFTFSMILINVYFSSMRGSVEQFKSGSGIFYQDRYAPICEAGVNIIASIILVNYIGLAGVFLGTLISNCLIVFWVKPYVVYKYVFNKPVIEYFKMYFKYGVVLLIPLSITSMLTNSIKYTYDLKYFVLNCIMNIIIINFIYILIFCNTEEFKYYKNIIVHIKCSKFNR